MTWAEVILEVLRGITFSTYDMHVEACRPGDRASRTIRMSITERIYTL